MYIYIHIVYLDLDLEQVAHQYKRYPARTSPGPKLGVKSANIYIYIFIFTVSIYIYSHCTHIYIYTVYIEYN